MQSPRLLVVCALVLAPIAGIPLSTTVPTAPPASGVGSGFPGTIKRPVNDSVSHLAIKSGQINNTTIETAVLDISGSITIDESELRRTYRIKRFDVAYENASNSQRVVDTALGRAANRTAELQERQKNAIEDYNTGVLSTQAFLRELAAITAEANQTKVLVKHIGRETTDNRVKKLKGELDLFTGPVRTRITSALQGDPDAPKRYFVRTSSQGVVLATIDDGQYVREANLAGGRTGQNTTGSIDDHEVINIINESYPSSREYGIELSGFGGHYMYNFDHSYGTLTTYVDSSSGEIFYEHQTATISDDHTVRGPQNVSGPIALTTNTTYAGGYMYVSLTKPENGTPVNGTIMVDNETVGTTDTAENDELYLLQPANGTTITGIVGNKTVSITLGTTSSGASGQQSKTPLRYPTDGNGKANEGAKTKEY